MGLAIDTIVGSATNPGAGPTALVAAPGDSFVVRNGRDAGQIFLESISRKGAAGGFVRVRSPLLHDFAQGIRLRSTGGNAGRLTPWDFAQPLQPQDALTAEISGGAAEVDSAMIQTWYSDLPGTAAILKMPGDVLGSVEQFMGQEVAVASGAAAGSWGDTAVNATFDNFKANRWYAVLGLTLDNVMTALAIKGADTGNLRVGIPASNALVDTRQYFADVSLATGRPHIPVFNSANKGATFVSANDTGAATTANVTLILALLSANWTP